MHEEVVADELPDRWLRVFAVAGNMSSFTEAAARLGLGQPAVSQAVKRLESALGIELFVRSTSGNRLTDAGQELHDAVIAAFGRIDQAVQRARSAERSTAVNLSVSTSLATHWLLPRLPEFKQQHPDIDLRCSTDDTDRGVGVDGSDIWIPHGSGEWPGLDRRHFADEVIYPVASPDITSAMRSDSGLAELLERVPLLHLIERYRARMDWARWAGLAGLDAPPAGGPHFSDYSLVLHAAMAGQGVALGWDHIVSPLIAEGALVQVGDIAVRTDRPFEVLTPLGGVISAEAATLRDWLISEASRP